MKGKRLRSEPTETPYAENGTYGVVGGRRLATASYPIRGGGIMEFSILEFIKSTGCFIRNHFHIYCPGCGGTRAVEALFNLQPVRSLYYNPAVILMILVAVCIQIIKIIEVKRGTKIYKTRILVYGLFLAIWFVYFIVRNILLVHWGIDMLGDFS